MLRKRFRWLLLIAGLFFVPAALRAQDGSVPPVSFVGPLSHMPYTDGGLYTGFGFLAMSTNQPLSSQVVARRGFIPFDSSITGATQGQFFGSQQIALNTNQVAGPSSFQPGWDLFVGWRFQGGVAVEFNWKHLVQNQFSATAALNPGAALAGPQLENTFITAPVYNFGTAWAGAPQVIPQGDIGSTFGIWDAASFMQELYIQRFDIYQINVRVPIWETADSRTYGLFGPRIAWIVDDFRWTTISQDQFGNDAGGALYSNSISNRMYGAHFGFGQDWYLGSTPIGAFSFMCDLEAALYFDDVKTGASYTLIDALPQVGSSRNRRFYSIVPGVDGHLALSWYPWEGISLRIGYDVNTFFNTIASDQPIDFNLGRVTPQYEHQFLRYFYGFSCGISFVW